MTESFFSTLKEKLGHSIHPAIHAPQIIFVGHIEVFYNRIRRHSALNYVPLLEHDRNRVVAQPCVHENREDQETWQQPEVMAGL